MRLIRYCNSITYLHFKDNDLVILKYGLKLLLERLFRNLTTKKQNIGKRNIAICESFNGEKVLKKLSDINKVSLLIISPYQLLETHKRIKLCFYQLLCVVNFILCFMFLKKRRKRYIFELYMLDWRLKFWSIEKLKGRKIFVTNDHIGESHFVVVANPGANVTYVQHGECHKWMPSNDFKYLYLFNKRTKTIYENKTNGVIKICNELENTGEIYKEKIQILVGLSNPLNYKRLKEFLYNLQLSTNHKIYVKFHPAEKNIKLMLFIYSINYITIIENRYNFNSCFESCKICFFMMSSILKESIEVNKNKCVLINNINNVGNLYDNCEGIQFVECFDKDKIKKIITDNKCNV